MLDLIATQSLVAFYINLKRALFSTMDVLSTAHDFDNVFSCCEARTKNKRCKQVILVITFILLTFDLVTDWINWKQWSEVGPYSWHQFVFIYRTTFLCVAVVGTVLNTTEAITIVVKLFRIHTVKTIDIETPSDDRIPLEIKGFYEQKETDETDKKNKFEEAEKSIKR